MLSFFAMLISTFGAFGWKIEAPWTIPLAQGASIGENMVYWILFESHLAFDLLDNIDIR